MVPRNAPGGMVRQARPPVKKTAPRRTDRSTPLPFKKIIARDHIRLIYILGAIAIILVSLLGISTGFSNTGTAAANESFTNTTALVQNPSSSPLFWIGFLIFASLIWRIFCEMAAMVCRTPDTISCGRESGPEDEGPEYFEEETGYRAEEDGEFVECPHCSKIIAPDQVRECEVCGVQGCSNCIRIMGLLKKKMTCKQCFERK
ncbi:MAG: DUF4282 domain-containing protein [Methanoregula sp.]|nr:DUF4282 domain-containing protein [Methanoregula sp.]